MKKIRFVITVFVCIVFVTCLSIRGMITVQKETPLPLADPFILCYNGMYYAYGTSSDHGFEVYYSSSLESWKKYPQLILSKENSYGNKWFWAPEVYYNQDTNKFYLYYSAEEHICVATSDSPLGPFVQRKKEPMRAEKAIDPSLFIDEDGTPYLFFVRFTHGNVIWMAELEKDWTTLKEGTLKKCFEVSQNWEKSMGRVVEGPSVLKYNGIYYLIYSANDFKSPDYGVGYATSDSPFGPWKKSDRNPILQNPLPGITGTGHGASFIDRTGCWKYVFHAHFSASAVQPRLTYIVDLSVDDRGIGIDKSKIVRPIVILNRKQIY